MSFHGHTHTHTSTHAHFNCLEMDLDELPFSEFMFLVYGETWDVMLDVTYLMVRHLDVLLNVTYWMVRLVVVWDILDGRMGRR